LEIYLDNSATTMPYPEVVNEVREVMSKTYGNPSSLHSMGIESSRVIETAKERISATLKCQPSEIYFTSGGTEANNLALLGACRANRGSHVITSAIEHPATLQAADYIQSDGYEIELLEVDGGGIMDLAQLENSISEDTVLVSIMHVNNEVGTVQDLEQIGRIIKTKNPKTVFHVDAVQSYCKLPVVPKNFHADMISLSSHKIHGPMGVGALYVKQGTKISPTVFGGGQQKNIRPGTENVPGIAGFGLAAQMKFSGMTENSARMIELRERLRSGILANVPEVRVNTPQENCAPHVLNVSFDRVKSEVLLHSLEQEGIFVSSGSACSSHKKDKRSYVLQSMAIPFNWIDGSIRFSLSEFISATEIDYTVEKLREIVVRLREI